MDSQHRVYDFAIRTGIDISDLRRNTARRNCDLEHKNLADSSAVLGNRRENDFRASMHSTAIQVQEIGLEIDHPPHAHAFVIEGADAFAYRPHQDVMDEPAGGVRIMKVLNCGSDQTVPIPTRTN